MTKLKSRNVADVLVRPLLTEKATLLLEQNKYLFLVRPEATKPQIRLAIESLFDVSVKKVNTMLPPRRKRRVGRFIGYKSRYKRAVITLKDGDTIALFPEV